MLSSMISNLSKMYELRFHRKVDKEIEKLPKEVKRKIKNVYFPLLEKEPKNKGKPLSGPLAGLWRLSFKMLNNEYRIAYEINDNENAVYILMIGKREKFYDRLKKRF